MNERAVFPPWALAAAITVALAAAAGALFFTSRGEEGGNLADAAGPSTFSRSAIGHAGVAQLLERAGFAVVESRFNSLEKLGRGGVLVVVEPRLTPAAEPTIRRLIAAPTVLLVLPKWTGRPDPDRPGWIANAELLPESQVKWVLRLASRKSALVRRAGDEEWSENALGPAPAPASPVQLARGEELRPIVGAADGVLVGEIRRGERRLWVLADPDVIANHGLGKNGNADFALALFKALHSAGGNVVFDEMVHGYAAATASPVSLLFEPPLVFATVQAGLAVLLLLWATTTRFGAPEAVPPAIEAGRQRLLQNAAGLLEFAGYEAVVVERYVEATIRYVAGQVRAPHDLSGEALLGWLQRAARARSITLDCVQLMQEARQLRGGGRTDRRKLAKLARDIDRWKREIIDGPGEHSRDH
jgi:hypothetical protein